MEKIFINEDNLKECDINNTVKRVKYFIINGKDEMLLANSYHEFQCPGGHVENKETLKDAIVRELKEETGMDINIENVKHFCTTTRYYKDHPEKGLNSNIIIYYYEIKTNKKPKLHKLKLTDYEKKGNFRLKYYKLKNIEKVFINNTKKYGDPHGISNEMLKAINVYKEWRNCEKEKSK